MKSRRHKTLPQFILTVVLLCAGLTGASVPDRCAFKTGDACRLDTKCIWEAEEEDPTGLLEVVMENVKSTICPTIAAEIIAQRGADTLATFLDSDDLCLNICGGYTEDECSAFLDGEALPTGEISGSTLRKLQAVFDAGEMRRAREVLTDSATFRGTIAEYMEKNAICEMCTSCFFDKTEFAEDILIFSNLDLAEITTICEAKIGGESGSCRSRCDPEYLDEGDCHKEGALCLCKLDATGATETWADSLTDAEIADEFAIQNVYDNVCPDVASVDAATVTASCAMLDQAKTDYASDITATPGAVCRAFCPPTGSCGADYKYEDDLDGATLSDGRDNKGMIASSRRRQLLQDDTVGFLDCILCEYCKEKPDVYTTLADAAACETHVGDITTWCTDNPDAITVTEVNEEACYGECAATGTALECDTHADASSCNAEAACRWVKHPVDVFEDYVETQLDEAFQSAYCPSLMQILDEIPEVASENEIKETCRSIMGCDDIDASLCGVFFEDMSSDDDGTTTPSSSSRKLLASLVRSNATAGHTHWRQGIFRRSLRTSDSDVPLADVSVEELGGDVASCAVCYMTCENPRDLISLSYALAHNDTEADDILADCEGSTGTATTEEFSQCQPVCSTIPADDCASYPDYCSCSYGHIETEGRECHCSAKPEFADTCVLQADDSCPTGCILYSDMLTERDDFVEAFTNSTGTEFAAYLDMFSYGLMVSTVDANATLDGHAEDLENLTTDGTEANITVVTSSVEDLTAEAICMTLGLCSADCGYCVSSGIPDIILDNLDADPVAISDTTISEFFTMLADFTFRREACALAECAEGGLSIGGCSSDKCEWECGIHADYEEPVGSSRYNQDCFCHPTDEIVESCTYDPETDACSKDCEKIPGNTWDDVYTRHLKQNLIYVSLITQEYKVQSASHSVNFKDSVEAKDVCAWIYECPYDTTCDVYAGVDAGVPYECEDCLSCLEAEPVAEILDIFKNSPQDQWGAGLDGIATKYAEEEAKRLMCRSTFCDSIENTEETCNAQDGCSYECYYHGHDVEFDEADFTAAEYPDDALEEEFRPDAEHEEGCADFMRNWSTYMKDPTPFCEDQEDLTVEECVATMEFLDSISSAGHFADYHSRLKLCYMFSNMPTVDLLKHRLGYLLCDSSQQCCGQTDAFDDTGIALSEIACGRAGCEYQSECVPIVDSCYETMLEASQDSSLTELPSCANGCTFIASNGLNSMATAHGRGFCMDMRLDQKCKISASNGCDDYECLEKPICEPARGQDFGCVGGDACCVSTLDGVIAETDCADGCALTTKCVTAYDECTLFKTEWDCNYERACRFVPLKNQYDRMAGKCIAKQNKCERLSAEACAAHSACQLIDSCETPVCDADDQCCGKVRGECQATAGCAYRGKCSMKKELDVCAYFGTDAACAATGTACSWDSGEERCYSTNDPCSSIANGDQCAYTEMCEFEEGCVDACDACETCIDYFATLETTASDGSDLTTSELQSAFLALCVDGGYDIFYCFDTASMIGRSKGTWAERPGALCLALDACRDGCTETGTDAAISLCTATGWDDGTPAPSSTDPCASCNPATEFCEKSSATPVCECNPATGFDTCKIPGTCVDKCTLYQDRINAYNALVETCEEDSDCTVTSFPCDTGTPGRAMTCSAGVVSVAVTGGTCLPAAGTLLSAKFDEFGRVITVELDIPARRAQFPCSEIFDAATDTILGAAAFCSVSGQQLFIYLRAEATIDVDDALTLDAAQTLLVDLLNGVAFVDPDPDITVATCDSCQTPSVTVKFPHRISAGCGSGDTPRAIFDGSQTIDYTGRALTCTWDTGVGGDDTVCHRDPVDSSITSACADLTTKLDSASKPVVELTTAEIATLAATPGFYTISLTCTNFLGASDSKEFEFEVLGVPVPVISLPQTVYFHKSAGIVVPAGIIQTSICPGDSVRYSWTSADLDIPDGEYTGKDFRMASVVGAFTAAQYTLDLEVTLTDKDGVERSESGTASVIVIPVATAVSSKLYGKSGDVVLDAPIVLTPFCYDPDDPEDLDEPFAKDYACVRSTSDVLSLEDSDTVFCETLGDVQDDSITLDETELTEDVWYIYTLTCTKDSRSHSSSLAFRTRSAAEEIPTGDVVQLCRNDCSEYHDPGHDIILMVQNLAYDDTEILWSCSITLAAGDVLDGDFASQRFTILAAAIPEVDSIDCIATLTRNSIVGEGRITIKINSKPFCSSGTGCVEDVVVSDNAEYPLAKFELSGQNFADDQDGSSLQYAFGCVNADGDREVFVKGTQSSFEIGGLDVGAHTCFVCVFDSYGSETCEETTVTVDAATGGVTEEMVDTIVDAVETAVASKDVYAVLQSVKAVASLSGVSIVSKKLRRLLQDDPVDPNELSMSIIEVQDGNPFVSDEFLLSAIDLSNMAEEVNSTTLMAVVDFFDSGLENSFLTSAVYSEAETDQLALATATVLAAVLEFDWADTDALTMRQSYSSVLNYAEDLVCSNIVLSQDDAITATLTGGSTATVSCLFNELTAVTGATHTVGDLTVDFPTAFATCETDCPTTIELRVSLGDNIDLPFNQLTSFPIVGGTDYAPVSGIVKITTNDFTTDPFCTDTGCAFNLTIPVADYNETKSTACLLINGVEAEGLDDTIGVAYVDESFSDTDSTVICEVSSFGEIFVLQYTTVNVTQVTEGSDVTLPPADDEEDPGEVVEAEFRFADLSIDDYPEGSTAANELKFEIVTALQLSSTVEGAEFEVVELRAGSVVAVVEVTFPAETAAEDIDTLVAAIEDDPASVFTDDFLATYGTPTVTLSNAPSPSPEASEDDDADDDSDDDVDLVLVIVPVVVGVVVLGGLVAAYFVCGAQSRGRKLDAVLHDV